MKLRFWNWWRRRAALKAVKHELEKLEARVGVLPLNDPLWPMLIALVNANVRSETEAVARPNIGDEEAHRARGRVGMLLDVETQLSELWEKSHRREG
jgi:hypothetical protein